MRKFFTFFLVLLAFSITISAEEYFSLLDRSKDITIQKNVSTYELGVKNIIVNSEQVRNHEHILVRNLDYKISYQEGKIDLLRPIPAGNVLTVTFQAFPEQLTYSYARFKKQVVPGQERYRPIRTPQGEAPLYSSASDLQVSGSKSFSLSLGNQNDLDFDQSLYLQLNGKLADNIFVQAQLSDNNSPITPQGTTEKLSELDNMMIKVYSDNYELTFGDFYTRFDDTHFANYDYKLEGVNFHWDNGSTFDVAATVSNGEFISYPFYGREGKQGPYYLKGKNGEDVKVLAGTEKIYLNGTRLTRGEHYTIDYNEGSIMFTNKCVITEDSYIIADYEYSSEDFRSNLYLGSSQMSFFDEKVRIFFNIISDSDNKDTPLNYSFSDEDKAALSEAGDNPLLAQRSGAIAVEVGQGNYIFNEALDAYEYVGYDTTGNYLVSFSFVGEGAGSYKKTGYNTFEYVGEGNGDYEPIIQLPMPEKNLNFDLGTELQFDNFTLSSEGIVSDYDKNTFSPREDSDNQGYAVYNRLQLDTPVYQVGEIKSGVFHEYRSKDFHSLARTQSAEEEYENAMFTDVDTVNTTLYGGDITFMLPELGQNKSVVSFQEFEGIAKQRSFSNRLDYNQNKKIPFLPSIDYYLFYKKEDITGDITSHQTTQTTHDLDGKYNYRFFTGSAGFYEREINFSDTLNTDIRSTSYNYGTDFDFSHTKLSLSYQREDNFQRDNYGSGWEKVKIADLIQGNVYWGHDDRITVSADYTHRANNYYKSDEDDSKYDLLDSQISFNFLEKSIYSKINYNIANLEAYPKVRELIYVGDGNGLYDSLGFYQEDGDYDYEITKVGEPQPITELQFNWNINLNPARYMQGKEISNSWLQKVMLTSDISVQEKSTTPHKIDLYLMRPEMLMNEQYTDYGYQRMRHQLWYNVKMNKIMTKLTYERLHRIDNQYENVFDKLWQDDWKAEVNLYNLQNWNIENALSYQNKKSNYQTEDFLYSDNYRISSEIGYKFNYNMLFSSEFAYELEKGQSENGSETYKIYSYQVRPQFTYSKGNKYHLTTEVSFQKNSRKGSDYLSDILYSKRDGLITRAMVQFNYRFSKYVTGFLSYFAENYPDMDTRHQLKMEIRADF